MLRLAGTKAALVAALGTGLAAVVTAVTVAAVRRGPAVAPPSGAAVPWVPLAAIGLVCLVVAVLGSVLAAAAALRDPGQTLAAAGRAARPGQTLAAAAALRDPASDLSCATCGPRVFCPIRGARCAGRVAGLAPGRGRGRPRRPGLVAP